MPAPLTIPLREWLPDQPDLDNPGLVDAKNVFKTEGGYQPARDIEFPGGDLSYDLGVTDGTVFDAISGGGGGINFYGAVTKNGFNVWLHAIDLPSTLSSLDLGIVSETGSLVNFGEDMYFIGGAKQYKSASGAAFSLVSSSAPSFVTTAARIGNFIMTGGNASIQWSGFNAPESWGASEITQANSADVNKPELGDVTQVIGGITPMLFQERGCSRLQYVGPPLVWATREVSNVYGAVPNSAIRAGGFIYFLSSHGDSDDFTGHVSGAISVMKTNGSDVVPVSSRKIDKWLAENFTTSQASRFRRPAVLDFERKQIVWPSEVGSRTSNVDGSLHKYLCMNWETEEFTYFEGDYNCLISGPWHRGSNSGRLVAFQRGDDNSLRYGPLTGDTLEATLTTGHFSSSGERTSITGAEPQYEGSGATIAVSAKERLRDAASFGDYGAENAATGIVPLNSDGRSTAMSAKFAAASDWSNLTGIVTEISTTGTR